MVPNQRQLSIVVSDWGSYFGMMQNLMFVFIYIYFFVFFFFVHLIK
jgi:hypothetical protein